MGIHATDLAPDPHAASLSRVVASKRSQAAEPSPVLV